MAADLDKIDLTYEVRLERYRYILRQIEANNQNTHRFLALHQTIATSLATASIGLFLGYRSWGISPAFARDGLIGLMILLSLAATFAVLLVLAGVFSWMDYRREECQLVNAIAGADFRAAPRWGSFIRWYETWVIGFICASTLAMWILALHLMAAFE
ncbi:hypothetical protein AB0893_25655 [Micromonospora aurantiaca]|uniref:hypothetical protein n=1 Tax=Micromonospora aurantiaca (nom. illeg.) TaxID=47850 RepID=UPI0034546674